MKKYTIREWFEVLPDDIRELAIENAAKDSIIDIQKDSFHDALSSAFIFASTKQGHNYWMEIAEKYHNEKIKPDIYSLTQEPFLNK